jgi:hypothetical protein
MGWSPKFRAWWVASDKNPPLSILANLDVDINTVLLYNNTMNTTKGNSKMKTLLLVLGLLLINPAHANELGFWDKFICRGAGTCYTNAAGQLTKAGSSGYPTNYQYGLNPSLPTTVLTPSGGMLIVPNHSGGGYPAAIIQISK